MTRGGGYAQPGNWKTLKARVLKRDGYTCYLCGGDADTADHVIPVAQGGTHDMDNLAAICTPCHDVKTETERLAGIKAAAAKPRVPKAPSLIEGHPSGYQRKNTR